MCILTDNEETVYEGNNPKLGNFQVNIPKNGNYIISVTGKQADGTPFTKRGAEQMKHLGLLFIILPPVAAILVGGLCGILGFQQNVVIDLSNGTSLIIGILLILISLIIRYVADLEERNNAC